MGDPFIVMGDVVRSRDFPAATLRTEFAQLVERCNVEFRSGMRSPFTVTLGDEFQGVVDRLSTAVGSILRLEAMSLEAKVGFKIRYVVVQGAIETPVNPEIAHGMMGAGLTRARALLTDKGRGTGRFRFELPGRYVASQLDRLFLVYDGLRSRWKPKDAGLILDMLACSSNAEIAERYGQDRSQVYKRRRTLLVREVVALRESILELAGHAEQERTG